MTARKLDTGTILNGRYRILRPLGRGGMGTVYLAEHEQLKTLLAIKEISISQDAEGHTSGILQNYEQEARLLVSLNHPNLPKVTDAFLEETCFYLVMEYIEGASLESLLRQRQNEPFPVEQVVNWAVQIAGVLQYLHGKTPPIIFRDIKPANIMLQPDGMVRLIDFGIARRFNPDSVRDTSLLGSVGYSPPEQFGRQQTDMRSDIYAFGATLHHLLTGVDPSGHPFKFRPASHINQTVPPALSELLVHCLQIDAEARPANVHEVMNTLLHIQKQLEQFSQQTAPTPAEISVSARPAKKTGLLWGLVFTVLLLGCAGLIAFMQLRPHGHKKLLHGSPPSTPLITSPPAYPPAAGQQTGQNSNAASPPQTASMQISLLASNVIFQPDNTAQLQITTQAAIAGHAGRQALMAVFFYLPDGTPVPSAEPNGSYANASGQLSMAVMQNVQQDSQVIVKTFDIPLNQFPADLLNSPDANEIRVRALLQIGSHSKHSSLVTVPIATLYNQASGYPAGSTPATPQTLQPPASQPNPGSANSAPVTPPAAPATSPPSSSQGGVSVRTGNG